jgi:hypothetical protein
MVLLWFVVLVGGERLRILPRSEFREAVKVFPAAQEELCASQLFLGDQGA